MSEQRPAGWRVWRGFVAAAVITVAFSTTDANRSPTRKTAADYAGKLSMPRFSSVRAIRGSKTGAHDASFDGVGPDVAPMDGRKLAEIGLPPVIIDTFAAIGPTDRAACSAIN